MSEASNSLLSEWTNIITAIATCSAVGVALFLHFHHLRKQKAAKIAEDEKNAVIALQAIYSELRALDAYFLTVELNLHNLNDERAISIIAKLGNPQNQLDPELPVDLVGYRMEALSRMPVDQASHYSSAIARYRIIRDHAHRLMDKFHGSSEALAGEQTGVATNSFYRVAALLREAAQDGANHTGCLIAEAEARDPGLKPVSVKIENLRDEVQLADNRP